MSSRQTDRAEAIALAELLTPPASTPTRAPKNNERPDAKNGDARHPVTVADMNRVNGPNL